MKARYGPISILILAVMIAFLMLSTPVLAGAVAPGHERSTQPDLHLVVPVFDIGQSILDEHGRSTIAHPILIDAYLDSAGYVAIYYVFAPGSEVPGFSVGISATSPS